MAGSPRSKRPWYRRATAEGEDHEVLSHLARSMAYEVAVVAVTAVSVSVILFVISAGQFEDLYLKLRGSAPTSDQVALLTIGEEGLYLYNADDVEPEVTPRALLGELVRFCAAAGAEVVVLDVLLDRPEDGDEALVAAIEETGMPVVGAVRFMLTDPESGAEFAPGLSPSLEGAVVAGFANLQEEEPYLFSETMLVRKAPLTRRVGTARLSGRWPLNIIGAEQSDDTVIPSITLAAAFLKTQGTPEQLHDLLQAGGELGLKNLERPYDGVLINFRGPEGGDGIPTVRAASALRTMGMSALAGTMGQPMPIEVPEELAQALRGRVVVIGRVDKVGREDADRFATPYSFPTFARPDMAGARIQAQVIDTLISGRHVRPVGGTAAWWLALLLSGSVYFTRRLFRDDVHVVGWSLIGLGMVGTGVLVFRLTDGLSLQVGPPLGAALVMLTAVHVVGWSFEESRRT